MEVGNYYKIVIPHRYWSAEFKIDSRIMYGVCSVLEHPILHTTSRKRQRVRAIGFHLTDLPAVYAPTWPGSKPNFSIVGTFLSTDIYAHLPTDVVKQILKYL